MRKFIREVIQETEKKEGNKIVIVSAHGLMPWDILRSYKISLCLPEGR